jgi:hypothetical protein
MTYYCIEGVPRVPVTVSRNGNPMLCEAQIQAADLEPRLAELRERWPEWYFWVEKVNEE